MLMAWPLWSPFRELAHGWNLAPLLLFLGCL